MTERQLAKAVLKAEDEAGRRSFRDKYTFYCVAAGIVGYGKYKPAFRAHQTAGKYRAKKGEKRAGSWRLRQWRTRPHTTNPERS